MNKIQYMHFRQKDRATYGGATLAIMPLDKNKVVVAIAHCNPKELFNKKMGRTIAAGRLQAFLDGRESVEANIREVTVPDMSRIKEAVESELQLEMAAVNLI